MIPDGSLVMGSPARIKRNLTWEGKLGIMENSKEYVTVSLEMKEQGGYRKIIICQKTTQIHKRCYNLVRYYLEKERQKL